MRNLINVSILPFLSFAVLTVWISKIQQTQSFVVVTPTSSTSSFHLPSKKHHLHVARVSSNKKSSSKSQFQFQLEAFKKKADRRTDDNMSNGDGNTESSLNAFLKKPANLIVAPFVLLFGLDLLANIAVVTKRSIEVLFTGDYTVWNPFDF